MHPDFIKIVLKIVFNCNQLSARGTVRPCIVRYSDSIPPIETGIIALPIDRTRREQVRKDTHIKHLQ